MSLNPGTRLGHYDVTALIGEGGMGQVYRATDTKLDRQIALKVLPADLSGDPERLERFQREARAVAALNHPNIVTIHSVEESDGTHFLTMELVEGTTLDATLADDGLSQARFLELAMPLASAVAAAHAKGITHRDLKPQNVMLTGDGRVKVLDFGLAKFTRVDPAVEGSADAATMLETREGLAVGTVPYMSPEQVEGRPVDARSDIFSLGVMFYEMMTGRRPFGGDSAMAVATAILRDTPSAVSDVAPGCGTPITEIVGRCLAKNPAGRYPDGRALSEALGAVGSAEAIPESAAPPESSSRQGGVPWIAVLPFKTRGADDELDALAEGLTEDVTAGLSLFSHLLVVSATSAAQYLGPADIRTVGAELGAHFLIEGSIRKAGATVRVRVQLVDTTTGTHLWAEHFDRDLRDSDVFEAQDSLTDRIVATVAEPSGVLTRALGALAATRPVDTLTAYECVIRFYAYTQQIHPTEHATLRSALEQAVKREPEHADAMACLSQLYTHEFWRLNPQPNSLDRALRVARHAVELDATSTEAHYALALALYFRRELGPFRQAADRVVALNPRDASHVGQMGQIIAFSGDWPGGLPVLERAMQLNPHHSGWLHFAHHWDHYRKREYELALEVAERINMPGYDMQSLVLAATCGQLGRFDEARAHVDTLLTMSPELAGNVRTECSKWLVSDELVEHIVDGLRKAGLEIDGDPQAVPDVAILPEAPRAFVGRQAEYEKLIARLNAVARGTGVLVLLGGEPGVGKTRLSEELLAEARQRGMLALTGHCYEEGQAPFAPFIEIIEQLLRDVRAATLHDVLGEDAADLARLVPRIRVVLDDVPAPAELEPEQQRRVLFNAVLDLFRRLSGRQPVVLLLDDLHWADDATVGLLQHLTLHFSTMPLLWLGTYRDVELDVGKPFQKAMAALVRQKQAVRMPVRRLPETAVAELLTALGGSAPPDALVEAIFQETEGNPFFVGEVFQHLSEEGKLFDESGAWKPDLTVDELDVPEGVRLVVGTRLERLSEATPTMLTAAAVVGRRFDLTLVEALSGLDGETFLDAIDEAEAAKLIEAERTGRDRYYVFTHELIRSTLLGALSLPRRQRLHARAADTIEQTSVSALEQHAAPLARHLYEAGAAADESKTVHVLMLAADQALEAGGFEAARQHVDQALSIEPADGGVQGALRWRRGLAGRSLQAWDQAIADWEMALPLFEAAGDRRAVARTCQELAHLHNWLNQAAEADTAARQGLDALDLDAHADRVRLLGYRAWALSTARDHATADGLAREAVAIAEEHGDARTRGEALLALSWPLFHTMRFRERADVLGRAVALLRPTGDLGKLGEALANLQVSLVSVGQLDAAAQTEEETRALGERLGRLDIQMVTAASEWQRNWLVSAGLDSQDTFLARACSVVAAAGGTFAFMMSAALARASLCRGRLDEMYGHAREAAEREPIHPNTGEGWGSLFLAECLLGHGDAAILLLNDHEIDLPRAGALNGGGAWDALFMTVEGLAVIGERQRAAELYPLTVEAIATGTVVIYLASHLLETIAGIAAAAGRCWDAAEAHYQTALRLADEMPFVSEQAEARYWYAWMLVDRGGPGDGEQARELLGTALAVYRSIGMPWHIERAEALSAEVPDPTG